MLGAIVLLGIGLILVSFGVYQLRSWNDLPLERVTVVYLLLVLGVLATMFATLRLVFPRRRGASSGGAYGSDPGLSLSDSGSGHGGDCGHGDGGGCGADGAGGH
jgi:multisubunit Na+/H+ antiporter MnhB subunit